MNTADILVLAGLGAAVIAAIAWIIRRKKQGKSGCGACPYSGNCKGNC